VKTMMRISSLILLTLIFCSTFVLGQDVWQLPLMGSSISLEYLSPRLSENYSSYPTSMYSFLATGNFQLRNDNRIIIEIPYVHYHRGAYEVVFGSYFTYSQPEYNSGNIGNLYFAYEIIGNDGHFSTTVGIYLPTASDKEAAPVVGSLFDYDQFALYVPNLLTLHPQFNYHSESNNLFLNIKGSPTITFLTKSTPGMHTVDLFVALSFHGGFNIGDFSAAIGWAGNFVATESGNISDRFIDQAGVMIGYKFAHFQPELFYRLPISKNLSDALNSVFGVSARYEF
jgi:hypothetical protein